MESDIGTLLEGAYSDMMETIDGVFSFNVDLARRAIGKLYGDMSSPSQDGVKFDTADLRLRAIVDKKKNEEVHFPARAFLSLEQINS